MNSSLYNMCDSDSTIFNVSYFFLDLLPNGTRAFNIRHRIFSVVGVTFFSLWGRNPQLLLYLKFMTTTFIRSLFKFKKIRDLWSIDFYTHGFLITLSS